MAEIQAAVRSSNDDSRFITPAAIAILAPIPPGSYPFVTLGDRLGLRGVSGVAPVDCANRSEDLSQLIVLNSADNLEAADQVSRVQPQHRLVIVLAVAAEQRQR